MKKLTYSDKLKDPRWQKKRLEILGRDNFSCQSCLDDKSTLHVHHKVYMDGDPWDIPNEYLITLCEDCHQRETENIQDCVSALNRAVKTQFLSNDIQTLSVAFYSIKMVHQTDVVTSALEYWLSDVDKMKQLVKEYFEYLKSKSELSGDDLPF